MTFTAICWLVAVASTAVQSPSGQHGNYLVLTSPPPTFCGIKLGRATYRTAHKLWGKADAADGAIHGSGRQVRLSNGTLIGYEGDEMGPNGDFVINGLSILKWHGRLSGRVLRVTKARAGLSLLTRGETMESCQKALSSHRIGYRRLTEQQLDHEARSLPGDFTKKWMTFPRRLFLEFEDGRLDRIVYQAG